MKKDVYRADIESLGFQCERHRRCTSHMLSGKLLAWPQGARVTDLRIADGQFGCASAALLEGADILGGMPLEGMGTVRPMVDLPSNSELRGTRPCPFQRASFLEWDHSRKITGLGSLRCIAGVTARNGVRSEQDISRRGVVHNLHNPETSALDAPHARKRDRSADPWR